MSSGNYGIEVDGVGQTEWTDALGTFGDANLYQAWAYAAARWGNQRTSRLVVTRGRRVAALAQVAVVQPLGMRVGLAQLRWGPVWEPRGEPLDAEVASVIVDALHEEYVRRRRLHLRVLPSGASSREGAAALQAALVRRFSAQAFDRGESFRTIVVDLRPDIGTIRRGLEQKWRNQLNRAERNGLVVDSSDAPDAFSRFEQLYEQMVARKRLAAQDVGTFRRVQTLLPQGQKMQVFICKENDQPVAGVVVSTVGHTGVYVLGATNDLGMKCKAAYLLQWHAIEYLKGQGFLHYDLGGINPQTNPGVYHFKRGFGGEQMDYISPYVSCGSVASRFAAHSLHFVRQFGTRPGAPRPASSNV
jgi:FemAB family